MPTYVCRPCNKLFSRKDEEPQNVNVSLSNFDKQILTISAYVWQARNIIPTLCFWGLISLGTAKRNTSQNSASHNRQILFPEAALSNVLQSFKEILNFQCDLLFAQFSILLKHFDYKSLVLSSVEYLRFEGLAIIERLQIPQHLKTSCKLWYTKLATKWYYILFEEVQCGVVIRFTTFGLEAGLSTTPLHRCRHSIVILLKNQ